MKNFKSELEKEYYILTPNNIGGETCKCLTVSFNDSLEIETFDNEADYLTRCNELGIESDEI